MNSRQRIKAVIARKPADRCGFWLGNPHWDTWPIYHKHFGTKTDEELRQKLNDDFRWISPQFFPGVYPPAPDGRSLLAACMAKKSHGQPGPFADCEDVREVDDFPWPKPELLQFDNCLKAIRALGDVYRASGFWTCFYHDMMSLFGMESYLMKMYTNPDVVHAVTDRMCEFYYEANERFFQAAGDDVDAFFFGNDFGTQIDLICGPVQFDEFIMPWFKKFTQQGHRFGKQVILHSCGSIYKVIGRLIDAGVDCLHPLQAKAANMSAEKLSSEFGGKVTFLGGVDTQQLLVRGTPDEIRADVRRLKRLYGPNLIVSPSHEALLPNVPPENVAAMADEAVRS